MARGSPEAYLSPLARLMDKDMYWHMSESEQPRNPVIDRGIALHKARGGEQRLPYLQKRTSLPPPSFL